MYISIIHTYKVTNTAQILTLLIRPNEWHKLFTIVANIIGSSWFAVCISTRRLKNCLVLFVFENEYFSATEDNQINTYVNYIIY